MRTVNNVRKPLSMLGSLLSVQYRLFKCTDAVPSMNYIGRQLDVSYIGRQMYGEISIYHIRI